MDGGGVIIDLFSGPRGWSVGLRMLGLDDIGIEWDDAACRTAVAAGFMTIRANVATYPTEPFVGKVDGFIASPPCPQFSAAGKRHGSLITNELIRAIAEAFDGRDFSEHIKTMAETIYSHLAVEAPIGHAWSLGERAISSANEAALSVQPARWIKALRPEWIALEQVPAVLPLWRIYAHHLEQLGYSVWCGALNAADYGVPQTRQRAILIASRVRTVCRPQPTHERSPEPSLFAELLPWISMAEALGWGMTGRPSNTLVTRNSGGGAVGSLLDGGSGARRMLATEKTERRWIDPEGLAVDRRTNSKGPGWREGAPMVATAPVPRTEPSPTLTSKAGGQWVFTRPATTIAGDSRCWPPGHKINAGDIARLGEDEATERYGDRAGTEAIKLTVAEALVLQSFPADYPVQGTKTKAFEQIGNAVPPLLAAHVLSAATGIPFELEAAA